MHKSWEKELFVVEINDKLGYSSIEIDESKIIFQGNEIYRIFGCIDRNTNQARVKCVLTDRTKNKLIPLAVKYVNTLNDNEEIDEDNEDSFDENTSIKTRIFSYCFRSSAHTNTIESLWHTIKDITNNFSGLTID